MNIYYHITPYCRICQIRRRLTIIDHRKQAAIRDFGWVRAIHPDSEQLATDVRIGLHQEGLVIQPALNSVIAVYGYGFKLMG
jgi:hypothetical protein